MTCIRGNPRKTSIVYMNWQKYSSDTSDDNVLRVDGESITRVEYGEEARGGRRWGGGKRG